MKHTLLHSLDVLPATLMMLAAAMFPPTGLAATLLVCNNSDAGAGSLRQALNDNFALGSGNLIVFSNIVTGTISLTSGELEINSDVTITGPGAKALTVSGRDSSRVFNILRGTVSISGLRIAGGYMPGMGMGAGICNSGDLTLGNCVISSCLCDYVGGGIANLLPGTLLMTNITVAGNSAAVSGGGIYNNTGLTVINCTFSGNNVTESYGGGIYNGGTLRITNSTFSGNSAFSGGGLYFDMDATSPLTLSSCTVVSNSTFADQAEASAISGTSQSG